MSCIELFARCCTKKLESKAHHMPRSFSINFNKNNRRINTRKALHCIMIITSLNAASIALFVLGLAATIVANGVVASPELPSNRREIPKNNFMRVIHSDLFGEGRRLDGGDKSAPSFTSTMPFKWKENEEGTAQMILVDITSAPGRGDATLYFSSELEDTGGFSGTGCSSTGCSGWFDVSFLDIIENLSSVVSITPSVMITNSMNTHKLKCGEGEQPGACSSLQIPLIRETFPDLTGAGLTIGVISDSFNVNPKALTTYQKDKASGDLPGDVDIFKESEMGGEDEGRAMLQLIYDIAPDAKLKFHTNGGGLHSFAAAIRKLAEEGCDVILDDVGKCKI